MRVASHGTIRQSEATGISESEFTCHNAHCFRIKVPEKLGPAQTIYYDIAALKECCELIRREKIKHPIGYIMACRIGPFIGHFYIEINRLAGMVYLNPDGGAAMLSTKIWCFQRDRYRKVMPMLDNATPAVKNCRIK